MFISSKRLGIFQLNFDTLIKWSGETSSHPMLKIWKIYPYATRDFSFIHTIGKYLDMVSAGNLHLGYSWINGVTKWRHYCDHVTFHGTSYNVCNFLVEVSTFKQAISLVFWCNKLGRKTSKFTDQIHFQKKSRDQVDKIIDHLNLSESMPNVSFKFILFSELFNEQGERGDFCNFLINVGELLPYLSKSWGIALKTFNKSNQRLLKLG